jgi:hypothetical protein
MDEIDQHSHVVGLRRSDPTTPGRGRRSAESARPKSRPRPKGVWCTALAAACKGEARCASDSHDADGEGRAVTSFTDPGCAVAAESRRWIPTVSPGRYQ